MKRKVFVTMLLISVAMVAAAKPVEKAVAVRVAENVLHKQVVDVTPKFFTECYLFVGADGEGFVLLSADDCARPLLAYSKVSPFPTEGMPENLVAWIDGYQREIASIKALGGMVDDRVTAEWNRLLKGTFKGDPVVAPLIETQWEQSDPYNYRCPL